MRRSAWGCCAGAVVLSGLVGGCANLDAGAEISRSADAVDARVGIRPSWSGGASPGSVPEGSAWVLTDREAVERALAEDAEVRSLMERVREARADLVQQGLLPNPVLNVELAWPIEDGGGTKVAVGLTQQLVALLTRGDRMLAAEDELSATVLDLSEKAMQTAARARMAHARARHARARLEPVRREVQLADDALAAARSQRAAGQATALDVHERQVAALATRMMLKDREADVRARDRELAAIVGVPEHAGRMELGEPVMESGAVIGDESAALQRALAQRLDVAASAARAQAALVLARVAPSEAFADLSAGAGFERTDDGRKELGPAISVPIPIFDTGAALKAKAEAIARQAEWQAIGVRRSAIAEVRSAWSEHELARARLRTAESEMMELASEGIRLAESSAQAGEADRLALITAKISAESARLQVIDARERAELAWIDLWRAVGGNAGGETQAP